MIPSDAADSAADGHHARGVVHRPGRPDVHVRTDSVLPQLPQLAEAGAKEARKDLPEQFEKTQCDWKRRSRKWDKR